MSEEEVKIYEVDNENDEKILALKKEEEEKREEMVSQFRSPLLDVVYNSVEQLSVLFRERSLLLLFIIHLLYYYFIIFYYHFIL